MGRCPKCKKYIDYVIAISYVREYQTVTLQDEDYLDWDTEESETEDTIIKCPICDKDLSSTDEEIIRILSDDEQEVYDHLLDKDEGDET